MIMSLLHCGFDYTKHRDNRLGLMKLGLYGIFGSRFHEWVRNLRHAITLRNIIIKIDFTKLYFAAQRPK